MTKVGPVKCTEFGHYSGSSVMTKAYQHILTRFSHYGDYVLSSRVCVVWIGLSFVTTRFPQGLGTDLKTLKNLCRDHPKASRLIDEACKQPHGGDRKSNPVIKSDNGRLEKVVDETSHKAGNSKEAGLRRLRKDRPDLHEQVLAQGRSTREIAKAVGVSKDTVAREVSTVSNETVDNHPTEASSDIDKPFTKSQSAPKRLSKEQK